MSITKPSPTERLTAMLRMAGELRFSKSHMAKIDLSIAQIALLRWVGRHPGSRLGEIAAGLELTAPTVSVGVRRLEKKGWLECRPDMRDKRAICVYLSERGARRQKQVKDIQRAEVNRLLGRLSVEEQHQLIELLEKMFSSGGEGERPTDEIIERQKEA